MWSALPNGLVVHRAVLGQGVFEYSSVGGFRLCRETETRAARVAEGADDDGGQQRGPYVVTHGVGQGQAEAVPLRV